MKRHRQSHHSHGSGSGKALASARILPAGVTWEQVSDVFSAALECPAEERDTFLSSACGGNAALMTEVRSLLRSLGFAGDFLEPGTAVGPPLSPSLLAAIDRVPLFTQFKPETLIGGRYRVQGLLGRGGAGEVYEAWDEELAIPVALKTLHFGAALGGAALRSLKQEAMLARAVVHPNVCRVYDLACHGEPQNGTWFLTMEVLRGETLAEHLRAHGRLTPEEAWPIVEHMAAGLEAAHQSGIVHLDLKSGNVMLVSESGNDQAVITDFGLARTLPQTGEDRPASGLNEMAGTPAYMSPEQVRGEDAGPAADIYALGIVLFEMVTGVLPFTGATWLEVAQRRLTADVPSPRSIVPELDERWETVIRRCLDREPRRRFGRAEDIPNALAGRLPVETDTPTTSLAVQHSLPAERDRLLGRDSELEALAGILAGGTRLVTLLGAAGMGKTRLAVRYGWRDLHDWPGGVWFCDLTEARDVIGIASAVGRSLGVPLKREDSVAYLAQVLAERRRCLLILDNMEQVTVDGALTVRQWLERAPEAQFLVTSRERLDMTEESVIDVMPLDSRAGLELFIERAQRLRPGLALDDEELVAAREVVRLLEGIPLAIELAGARMRVMSATQIEGAMQKRFSLLTGGAGTRHETLAAAIDGSWELLEPWEKAALAQCAVFEGGFTLAAAESVLDLSPYSDAPWPVDVVQSLLDKSLLQTRVPEWASGSRRLEARFGMYVSLQEYARTKLGEVGAVPQGRSGPEAVCAAEIRHGRWYGGLGSEQALRAVDRGGVDRQQALGNELDNLTAASRRAAARGDGETATLAYRAASVIFNLRGPQAAALELGREVLAGTTTEGERALALMMLARVERAAGRIEDSVSHFESALVLFRKSDNRGGEGIVLHNLGALRCDQGRTKEASGYFEAALAVHRERGDRSWEAVVLGDLGNVHRIQGRVEEARDHYETALAIHREVENQRLEGVMLGNLATLHFDLGEVEEARAHYETALAIHRAIGDRHWEGVTLAHLGGVDHAQGRMSEARGHYEAALAISREVGNRRREGIVRNELARLDHDQGRTEDALSGYEVALAIHREVGNESNESSVLCELGYAYRVQGQMAEAHRHYRAALAISLKSGERPIEGIARCGLGILHSQQGQLEEAQHHLEAALAIYREASDRRSEGIVLGHLARVHFEQGRAQEARESIEQGEAMLRTLDARANLAHLLCIRAVLEQRFGQAAVAAAILSELETLAVHLDLSPDSELGGMIAKVREALS